MTKKKYALFILTCFFAIQKLPASPIISMFFRSYHQAYDIPISNERIQQPGKLAQHTAEGILDHQIIQGIFATYAGYIEVSNGQGQISFPRKHVEPSIHIIVTPVIIPMMMIGNTVHHWETVPGTPTAHYRYTRVQDRLTTLSSWEIASEEQTDDHVIPVEAIVILTNPSDIFIPTGSFPTNDTESLLLPDIFVKRGIKVTDHALYFLTVAQFFRPIGSRMQKRPLDTSILLDF